MVGPAILATFLPARLGDQDDVTLVQCGFPPFPEPFIGQTLLVNDGAPHLTMSVDQLNGLQPSVQDPVFLAHCGRSGSTLLCRMLDLLGCASFREPDPLINAAARPDVLSRDGILNTIINQYGWVAEHAERLPIIKLPSHAADLVPVIARPGAAAPIFLLRDAATVIAQTLTTPPHWLIRAATDAGLQNSNRNVFEVTGDVVLLMAHFWMCAVTQAATCKNALVLRYDDLVDRPKDTLRRCCEQLDLDPSKQEIELAVDTNLSVHAKNGASWDLNATNQVVGPVVHQIRAVVASTIDDATSTAEELCGGTLER